MTRTSISISLLLSFAAFAETADSIMARVAENQARSVEARTKWTHKQETFCRLSRFNGKMAREELKEFTVMPTTKGYKKEMVRFEGRYEEKGKIVPYDKPGYERKDMDIDAELVDEFPDELLRDGNSRDGIDSDRFPFTADKVKMYTFQLHGKEQYKDREVWKITFKPLNPWGWAGETLIDTTEYQPVLVTTHLAKKIPLVVRTMLGTDIQHLGFKVEYARLEQDVWMPVKYAGEFNLKAVFFYKRRIAINMKNSDFRKADVNSTITYEQASIQ